MRVIFEAMDRQFILAPQVVSVRIDLDQTHVMLNAMLSLEAVERFPGMSERLTYLAAQLPPERRQDNRLITAALYGLTRPPQDTPHFEDYIAYMAQQDAVSLRDEVVKRLFWEKANVDPATILADQPAFVAFFQQMAEEHEMSLPAEQLDRLFSLLNDPTTLKSWLVAHLRWMWSNVLAAEWEQVKGLLHESVSAFQKQPYEGMSAYEAIRAVTGRDLRGKWDEPLQKVQQMIFIPSPYLGPYLTLFFDDSPLVRILFSARLPDGVKTETPSALSRSDILVRLSALADDQRLRMLEIIAAAGELCAQDMIEKMEISQSAASRHLRQLSATGYLIERTRHGSKCYTLNMERIHQTMQGLGKFLLK